MMTLVKPRNRAVWVIRILLIVSIVINAVYIAIYLIEGGFDTKGALVEAVNRNVETAFWAIVTFALTFLHDYFEKHQNVHIPGLLESAIVIFLYASIFLSAAFNLYYELWWWDVLLPATSGVLLGFVGFLLIYRINHRYSMNISPLLVALFALTFSVTMNVLFEIYEFTMDYLFGSAMQSWDLPIDTVEIGRNYQGSGLRDTMSDLIVDTLGGLGISLVCYFLYRDEKKKALKLLHNVFPGT